MSKRLSCADGHAIEDGTQTGAKMFRLVCFETICATSEEGIGAVVATASNGATVASVAPRVLLGWLLFAQKFLPVLTGVCGADY